MKSKIAILASLWVRKRTRSEQLALERGEEALTHCIVVAVAHRSRCADDSPSPSRRPVDSTSTAGRRPRDTAARTRSELVLDALNMALGTAAGRIDHDRQIQEPGPRRHVRDVRHPELVGTRCSEVTLNEIRGRTRVAIPSRRPRSPSTRDPLDPGSAHESRDPLATDRYAVGASSAWIRGTP